MKNINHDRPELLLKDNFKREFARISKEFSQPENVQGWPEVMQPLVKNPKAFTALAALFDKIDHWLDSVDCEFNLSVAPREVVDSLNHLLRQRIVVSHSNGLKVKDWIQGHEERSSQQFDLRPILRIFRDLWL